MTFGGVTYTKIKGVSLLKNACLPVLLAEKKVNLVITKAVFQIGGTCLPHGNSLAAQSSVSLRDRPLINLPSILLLRIIINLTLKAGY